MGNHNTWQISICFISSWFLFWRSSTIEAFANATWTVLSASSKAASFDLVRRSSALLSSCSFAIWKEPIQPNNHITTIYHLWGVLLWERIVIKSLKATCNNYLLPSKLELSLQRCKNRFNGRHIVILLRSMNPSKSGFCCKLSSHGGLLFIIDFLDLEILQKTIVRTKLQNTHTQNL